MNITSKKYFNYISKILKKIKLDILYLVPEIYKYNQRNDIQDNRYRNFFNNLFFFNDEYIFQNKKKFLNSEIIFISHYVGNTFNDKDLDFYYGSLFKFLKKKKFIFQ